MRTISLHQDRMPFKQLIDKAAQPLAIPMELKGQVLKQEVSDSIWLTGIGSAPKSGRQRV